MSDEPDYEPPGESPSQPPFVITITDADDRIDEYVSMGQGTIWMGPYEGDEALTLDEVIERVRRTVSADERGSDSALGGVGRPPGSDGGT